MVYTLKDVYPQYFMNMQVQFSQYAQLGGIYVISRGMLGVLFAPLLPNPHLKMEHFQAVDIQKSSFFLYILLNKPHRQS